MEATRAGHGTRESIIVLSTPLSIPASFLTRHTEGRNTTREGREVAISCRVSWIEPIPTTALESGPHFYLCFMVLADTQHSMYVMGIKLQGDTVEMVRGLNGWVGGGGRLQLFLLFCSLIRRELPSQPWKHLLWSPYSFLLLSLPPSSFLPISLSPICKLYLLTIYYINSSFILFLLYYSVTVFFYLSLRPHCKENPIYVFLS